MDIVGQAPWSGRIILWVRSSSGQNQTAGLWHLPLQHIVAVHDRDNVPCRNATIHRQKPPDATVWVPQCHKAGPKRSQARGQGSVASTSQVEKVWLALKARHAVDELVGGIVQAVASTFDFCMARRSHRRHHLLRLHSRTNFAEAVARVTGHLHNAIPSRNE
ncbi:hypothetical protein AC579_5146 [Pseudocercospora musae]|uniref:Uncharacterized protein n=1 Tax=Pseudocercospora musae TaxID=113226 RepID=A0A139IPA9_9PEZI|nr:hypothetical protein AC579_5146 [Pseudocercospora musae]